MSKMRRYAGWLDERHFSSLVVARSFTLGEVTATSPDVAHRKLERAFAGTIRNLQTSLFSVRVTDLGPVSDQPRPKKKREARHA